VNDLGGGPCAHALLTDSVLFETHPVTSHSFRLVSAMPSLSGFEVSLLATRPRVSRLPELDVQTSVGKCTCYVPSAPDQTFRVMVSNASADDACISLFVDGDWIYSGLSYQPDHKTIYFSGRLIDESTIQEMKFVDLDTTCNNYLPWTALI
jgi:hypothetical protein